MWKIRISVYAIGAALAGAAAIAAALGWGEYDPVARTFDPPPIDLAWLAGWVVTGAGNAIAALAVLRGWGRK